jgi:hypothetical protein
MKEAYISCQMMYPKMLYSTARMHFFSAKYAETAARKKRKPLVRQKYRATETRVSAGSRDCRYGGWRWLGATFSVLKTGRLRVPESNFFTTRSLNINYQTYSLQWLIRRFRLWSLTTAPVWLRCVAVQGFEPGTLESPGVFFGRSRCRFVALAMN